MPVAWQTTSACLSRYVGLDKGLSTASNVPRTYDNVTWRASPSLVGIFERSVAGLIPDQEPEHV